jgi:Zn-dependent M28 family amino/carboxypeptidase
MSNRHPQLIQFARKRVALLVAVLLLTSITFGSTRLSGARALQKQLTDAEQELVSHIKVEQIREDVAALSAEDMLGRGTAQPGGDKAAGYLAERFAKLNLKPLGAKNSFLQPIKFRDFEFLPETSFKLGDQPLKLGPDFAIAPPHTGEKNVSGSMIFIAYGVISDVLKRNDVAGINLNGKIVVMLEGPPQIVSKESWKKVKAQITIITGLVQAGVAGIVFINHGREEHSYAELSDYYVRRQLEREDATQLPSAIPPFVSLSDGAADQLFAKSGISRKEALLKAETSEFKPIDLKQNAKITVRVKKGKGTANNVIGMLEGSDPKLKNEAIVYSAHYDAYGVAADNRIYRGAADNALGVAEMLAVAEAFTKAATKPKRSIIFMAVTGEEYGGLGTEYWTENPTWKLKQTAADLNLDGMGTEVYGPVKTVVGYGAEHSSLGSVLDEVAEAEGVKVIPDPRPDEKSFYRSDHYFFVKRGIPGMMLLGAPAGDTRVWIERMKQWEKTDYHQPTDTMRDDWNWEGPRTVARLMAVIGFRISNDANMPTWVATSPFNRERGTTAEPPPIP